MLASTLVAIPFVPVFFVLVRRVAGRRTAARPGLAAASETATSTP
jgi:hypothetical protein